MSFSVTRTFHKQHEGNTGFRQQRVHDYLYGKLHTLRNTDKASATTVVAV